MTASTVAVRAATRSPHPRRTASHARRGYLRYLAPGLVAFTVVVLAPALANVWLSLTEWSGVGAPAFIGLDNYATLLHDGVFWRSFAHSVAFIVSMALVPTALGLLLAAVLFDYLAPRFGNTSVSWLRALYYLPQILPIVIVGVLWNWLLQPTSGVVNDLLRSVGLDSWAHNWLGDASTALPTLMAIMVWIQLGYTIVIFLSGMSRMDNSLHEAAQLDGATWIQRFFHITVNQLRPEIAVILVTTTVAALKVFGPVYVMTQGGPNNATNVPSYFSYYQFFTTMHVGYGAAIATVLAVLLTALAVVMLRIQHAQEDQ